jgi:hypothetical protein
VKLGVRPAKPDGRDGRLREREENRLLDVAEKSSRPWLEAAVIISIEIRVRKASSPALLGADRRISLYRRTANEERQASPGAAFGPSGRLIRVVIAESVRRSDRIKVNPSRRDGLRHHLRIPRRGQ